MKQGKSIVDLAQELQRRASEKQDFVTDTREIYVNSSTDTDNPSTTLELGFDSGREFDLTQLAVRQMSTWAGIPAKYVDMMRAEAPKLFDVNLNHWLKNSGSRRMVRTLDGNARAFLSDRYRRIDNEDVAETVLPILLDAEDIQIASCDVTDSRLYIKALFPRVRDEVVVGDEVQAGVVISNSEIGLGSLSVQPLVFRLVCLNGMIASDSGLKRYHVGRKVEGDGQLVAELFRDETLQADDKALMMKIQDVVRAASSRKSFEQLVARMRESTEGPKIEKPVAAVEILGKSIGLNEAEKGSVLENLIRGGDYSRWGALNAVTAIANTHEDYDRATELEALGGKVLDLPAGEWIRVAEAA